MNTCKETINEIASKKGIFGHIAKDISENYNQTEAIEFLKVLLNQYYDDPLVGNRILGPQLYKRIRFSLKSVATNIKYA